MESLGFAAPLYLRQQTSLVAVGSKGSKSHAAGMAILCGFAKKVSMQGKASHHADCGAVNSADTRHHAVMWLNATRTGSSTEAACQQQVISPAV
jgi:hypothetical protein